MPMLRDIVTATQSCSNKCCPLPEKFAQLRTSTNAEDRKLNTRLEGFAYLYMMIWAFVQLAVFVILMVAFYLSKDNRFMRDQDCCASADFQDLTRHNNDLPLQECSNKACQFTQRNYDTIFSGAKSINDPLPREPQDGDYSHVFHYEQQWWCCNLDANSDECCNKLPYGASCAALMWMAGFSAVCAMFTTQVMLQGFYSFWARRNSVWTLLSVFIGILLRLLVFCLLFYFFFGFMFLFIFFWIPMIRCDNPYAIQWWRFGYLYVLQFGKNWKWIVGNGFNQSDGNMDFDQLISTHTSLSVLIDFIFAALYIILSKIKDNRGQPYCHLIFFRL